MTLKAAGKVKSLIKQELLHLLQNLFIRIFINKEDVDSLGHSSEMTSHAPPHTVKPQRPGSNLSTPPGPLKASAFSRAWSHPHPERWVSGSLAGDSYSLGRSSLRTFHPHFTQRIPRNLGATFLHLQPPPHHLLDPWPCPHLSGSLAGEPYSLGHSLQRKHPMINHHLAKPQRPGSSLLTQGTTPSHSIWGHNSLGPHLHLEKALALNAPAGVSV